MGIDGLHIEPNLISIGALLHVGGDGAFLIFEAPPVGGDLFSDRLSAKTLLIVGEGLFEKIDELHPGRNWPRSKFSELVWVAWHLAP